jgi:hypothetical protein
MDSGEVASTRVGGRTGAPVAGLEGLRLDSLVAAVAD